MPTLELTPEKAHELLELADRADEILTLDLHEKRRLRDLAGDLRSLLLGVPR